MNKTILSEEEWVQVSQNIAPLIKEYSNKVDQDGEFPVESINLLRENGLLGIMVPKEYGGEGVSLDTILKICKVISGACLSTGMIWAMHVQQVYIVQTYFDESLKLKLLPRIAAGEVYIVSVTSDNSTGNGPMSTSAYLQEENELYKFERHAPTVTGAKFGDAYLIIMRKGENNKSQSFVLAERSQVELNVKETWDSMGMRGTKSCEITIKGSVPKDHITQSHDFDTICNETMNPIAHLVWAGCWLGAVEAEYSNFISLIRSPKYRKKYSIDSDLLMHEVGNIRMKLDVVDAYINQFKNYYLNYKENNTQYSQTYKIKVNNLKILSSEVLCEVMDLLVQQCGVKLGYVKNQETSVEKVYRDIRSSRLMISNERLKVINGKLCVLEKVRN